MTGWLTTGFSLLQQAAQALPDTIVTKQVEVEPGLFQKITGYASGIASIALCVLTVALVPAAWNFRKSYAKISDLLDRVYGDVNPLMRHASPPRSIHHLAEAAPGSPCATSRGILRRAK